MSKSSPAPTVVSGLKQALVPHAPFSGMLAIDIERVVRSSKIRYFAPGEVVLAPAAERPASCFVRHGSSAQARCFRSARCWRDAE